MRYAGKLALAAACWLGLVSGAHAQYTWTSGWSSTGIPGMSTYGQYLSGYYPTTSYSVGIPSLSGNSFGSYLTGYPTPGAAWPAATYYGSGYAGYAPTVGVSGWRTTGYYPGTVYSSGYGAPVYGYMPQYASGYYQPGYGYYRRGRFGVNRWWGGW